jgi:AmmeMemoRadiSam system protein A
MKELLNLARQTLIDYFENKEVQVSEKIKEKYSEERACFVTLTKNGELRGCIGSLYPRQELWREVVENTLNSAFSDTRFCPVIFSELKKIKIEISVLSIPKKISYKTLDELKKKITGKGVILKQHYHSATYLPQVWDEINSKEEFLSSLSQKAGLARDAWKEKDIEVKVYDVEKVNE